MGETVDYMGHVNIVPSLSQDQYDYLFGLTEPWMPRTPPKRRGQPEGACGWDLPARLLPVVERPVRSSTAGWSGWNT